MQKILMWIAAIVVIVLFLPIIFVAIIIGVDFKKYLGTEYCKFYSFGTSLKDYLGFCTMMSCGMKDEMRRWLSYLISPKKYKNYCELHTPNE